MRIRALNDHLHRHMADGTHLKDLAHREFVRALRTGRMMAFVGSYATEKLGYPSWIDLLTKTLAFKPEFLKDAKPGEPDGKTGQVLDADLVEQVDPSKAKWFTAALASLSEKNSDKLVTYELLELFLKNASSSALGDQAADPRQWLDGRLHKLFDLEAAKNTPPDRRDTTVWQLCRNLGVRRIITTNYDMEFEYELMMDDADRTRGVDPTLPDAELKARQKTFKRCQEASARRREREARQHGLLSRYDFAIEHTMPDSRAIVSDCFQRERSDKLFEFALGSPDFAWHVMHLHGRISDPETLIISYGDYEKQYRQSSITKLPFEHAMKLLFAGNPILFVGMGMSEDEILDVLRQFVSDGSPGHLAPHFLIWSPKQNQVEAGDELFRLRLYRQFGIHVLFDCELDEFFESGPSETALPRSIKSLARFADRDVRPFEWQGNEASSTTEAAGSMEGVGLSIGGDFRDMQGFLPVPIEGDDASDRLTEHNREKLRQGSIIWGAKRRDRSAGNDDAALQPSHRQSRTDIVYRPIRQLADDPFLSRLPASQVEPVPTVDLEPETLSHHDFRYLEPIDWLEEWSAEDPDWYLTHAISGGSAIKAFIDKPGRGHGHMAAAIGDFVRGNLAAARAEAGFGEVIYCQVNGSFSWELDSAFGLVSGLYNDRTAYRTGQSRDAAADDFFNQLKKKMFANERMDRALFIAINGADRFFDSAGYPLSNELDLLIRRLATIRPAATKAAGVPSAYQQYVTKVNRGIHPVTLMLFGTARIGRYLASLGLRQGDLGINRVEDFDIISGDREPFTSSEPEPGHFQKLLAEKAPEDANPWKGSDPDRFRSTYFRSVRDAFLAKLAANGVPLSQDHPGSIASLGELVPLSLLTALAPSRIGSSTDARQAFFDVVLDTRLLARALNTDLAAGAHDAAMALEILRTLAFLGQPSTLATLRRALLGGREAPGRDLPNEPIGEFDERLKRVLEDLHALDLVIEIAQFPGIDRAHAPELRRFSLHRALLHEIRDRNSVPISDARNYTSFNVPLMTAQPIDDHEPEDDVQHVIEHIVERLIDPETPSRLASKEYGMDLRAACASLRSYYTTSTLLMHEPDPFPSDRHSPKLLGHAERLSRLIHRAEKSAEARRTVDPLDWPPNFFPDDLVWLHAQRGVALMALGDLYGARDSLGKASAINNTFVEFGDHGQNWRRLQLNQIHLDIERAKIASAEARIRDLIASIVRAVDDATWEASWLERTGEKKPQNAFEAIMQAYGTEPRLRVREVDPFFASDLILATGLACGYSGWCEFLRGRLRTAAHYFSHCTQILRNIGEQRAYAMFGRQRASLMYAIGEQAEGENLLMLCQAAADSSRQMDISHLAALDWAEHRFADCLPEERANLLHSVMDSLRYATLTDMYRVRMEARRVLALMLFSDGDYDGALEHAAEALAVATRFGFSLRKIALRILVAQILVERGDPISGTAMLEQASRIADRLGYQRAVEKAHRVRLSNDDGIERRASR